MTPLLRTLPLLALLAGCATTSSTPAAVAAPLEQLVEQQVAVQAPGATRVGQVFAGNGPKMDFMVQLERGNCYWFSGRTDDAGEKLSLYLWGPPYARRLTDSRSPTTSATMGHCPVVSGMYKFEAKTRREGTFVVGVYAKPALDGSIPPVAAAYAPQYGTAVVVDAPGYGVVAAPPTECRMGSDGMSSCGYNCKLGSKGHFYCASIPGGQCALNSDGSWSCP